MDAEGSKGGSVEDCAQREEAIRAGGGRVAEALRGAG